MKQRIGFYDFTGCEGCQLTVLNLEDQLLDLLDLVDIVAFREVMDGAAAALDIAFVEGSIGNDRDRERLRDIRRRSRVVVALGACADTTGVNALALPSGAAPQPLNTVITVDHRIPGCPIDGAEFLAVLKALLMDKAPELPTYSLCVECKLAELPCTFEEDNLCLGPVVRAGCGAICIEADDRCRGCRGLIDNPRTSPYFVVATEHGVDIDRILEEFRIFNIPAEEAP